jgi:PPM family protein phosphatase
VGGPVPATAVPLHAQPTATSQESGVLLTPPGLPNLPLELDGQPAPEVRRLSTAGGVRLLAASVTHPGLVRTNNEDTLAARIPEDEAVLLSRGALFAIADGLGGMAAGEVASQQASETLLAEFYSPRAPHQIESALRAAVQAANARVYNLAHGSDTALRTMQTTLTALVLAGRQAYLAHAGDSRIYLLRDGTLSQLTADHSEAAELLRLRLISAEQAHTHPRRNVLTRSLGSTLLMRPDFQRLTVQAGDRFLLCSDGLWGEVEPDALLPALDGDDEDAHGACARLLTLALKHGGGDNVSLHVIHVLDPGPAPAPPPSGRIARLLSGLRGGG